MSPTTQSVLKSLLCLCALASFAHAQLIRVEGGSSDVLDADGGQIEYHSRDYNGYFSAGNIQGQMVFGSYLTTVFHGYTLNGGDFPVALDLPTDIFDSSHFILARGISASHKFGDADVYAFGGESAVGAGAPFFQAATGDTATAALFVRKPLTSSLSFFSRNVFSDAQTSIQGLEWRPADWLHAAASGGIGGDTSYASFAGQFDKKWVTVKMAYIMAGDRFRRFTVQSPITSEVEGANLEATFHPRRDLVVVAAHQNYLEPQPGVNTPSLKATVNDAQADWTSRYIQLGGGIFSSAVQGQSGLSEALWASRHIVRNIDAGVNYFHSQFGSDAGTNSITGTVREILTPRLSLLEVVGRSAGQTQFLMGGTFISNRFSIDVNYQTIYLPFSRGGNPFQQGLAATIQLRTFQDLTLNGQTFLGNDGKVHYTAFASKVFERAFGWMGSGPQQSFRFPKFVFKGRVVDDHQQPIPGIAIHIGNQLLMTNGNGEFLLRTGHRDSQSFAVALDESINPTPLEVRSAPRQITPEPEDSAVGITVVLVPPAAKQEPHQ